MMSFNGLNGTSNMASVVLRSTKVWGPVMSTLLMYKITLLFYTDFASFNFTMFVKFKRSRLDSIGSFKYRIMSSANQNSFTSSFSIFLPLCLSLVKLLEPGLQALY